MLNFRCKAIVLYSQICFLFLETTGKKDLLKIALLLREANKISEKLKKNIVSISLFSSQSRII